MDRFFRVNFLRPGFPDVGTLVPVAITPLVDMPGLQPVASKSHDTAAVQLQIPASRRTDDVSVIRAAVETLRAHYPYQAFILNLDGTPWGSTEVQELAPSASE